MTAEIQNSKPQLRRCVLLLPGYELDGFPRSLESQAAAELLSGWVSLWHPNLIGASGQSPRWQSADQSQGDLTGTLAILPSVSKSSLDPTYTDAEERREMWLLEPKSNWRSFQRELLQSLELQGERDATQTLVAEVTPTFAALGYAYLQIQIMTRQLRYTSNLDQGLFDVQLTDAAHAALSGDREQAIKMLQSCFDCLGQERDHYYSLDIALLDITLMASTTLGHSLSAQLEQKPTSSYLMTAGLLRKLADEQPESERRLREQIEVGNACLVGGLDEERPHPLMSGESLRRDLARGREGYRGVDFGEPKVFGRLSFGLTPDQPMLLKRNGFEGALLVPWTGGTYPEGTQAKLSWEASDGTYLPALATSVLDAADPNSFLALGWDAGEALDHQHVPSLLFAHWPNRTSDFYELLHLVCEHTPALGKFYTAESYFSETDQPYHQERLNAHGFRYDWLDAPKPLTWLLATKRFHLLQAVCRSLQNLANLGWQLKNPPQGLETDPTDSEVQAVGQTASSEAIAGQSSEPETIAAASPKQWCADLAHLLDLADSLLDDPAESQALYDKVSGLARRLSETICRDLMSLVSRIPAQAARDSADCSSADSSQPAGTTSQADGLEAANRARANPQTALVSQTAANEAATGMLSFNPQACPVRMRMQTEADQEFVQAEWKFASGRVGHHRYTCVDVPSLGFVAAPLANETPGRTASRKQTPLAQAGGLIQNEFLEAQVDSGRGHLRALHAAARRGNRLSMMVARRDVGSAGKFQYSEMAATDVRMLTSSNMCGVVRAQGNLEFRGQRVARFEIDYEAWRGSRILEVVIRLSELAQLSDDNPWRSAYVIRLAWPTEAAIVRTHAAGWQHSWPSGVGIAPTLIEIDETDYRTHYLTGGLAFHRRLENRFLETILPIEDSQAEHRLGLAVDLPYPQMLAADFIDQRYAITVGSESLRELHGWLVSVNVKNVQVDLESPLIDGQGRNVGLRLYLTEWAGKSTSCTVRLMHRVASASRVAADGQPYGKLTVQEDAFTIAMRSHEQCLVDVRWA